ncbi:MAG: BolA family transcriptional regulator [Alphaproteobacteria bacterium]|nr:BolA family transcriptional regulator [Alphaproteobacteria bacterium]
MSVRDDIACKLREAFKPSRLEVIDESHLHIGHVGARPGGETHFRVEIATGAFHGMSRIARQKAVYDVLAQEMAGPVHALSIKAEDG